MRPDIVIRDTATSMRRLFGLPLEARPQALRELYGLDPDGFAVGSAAGGPAAMALRAHEPGGDAFQLGIDDPRYPEAVDRLVAADAWGQVRAALARAWDLQEADEPATSIAPQIEVTLVLGNPDERLFVDRTLGYYGMGSIPGAIWLVVWPTGYNANRIGACAVHEFAHQIRGMNVPWQTTVADWVISEGLAEVLAAAVCGPDATGGWYAEVRGEVFDRTYEAVTAAFDVTGFGEASAYVLGDETALRYGRAPAGVPHMGGYAVGRAIVERYLRVEGRSIASALLRPTAEIARAARE